MAVLQQKLALANRGFNRTNKIIVPLFAEDLDNGAQLGTDGPGKAAHSDRRFARSDAQILQGQRDRMHRLLDIAFVNRADAADPEGF